MDSNDYLCLLEQPKQQISDLFGHEFAMMQDYSQNNPHHCYDLLEHTLRTLIGLDCSGLSPSEEFELKIAALYHDVGKPHVAFDKGGKTVFYNHAKKSREIFERELPASMIDEHTINKICFFIEYHDMFINFKLKEELNPNNPYLKEITSVKVKNEIDKIVYSFEKTSDFIPSYHDFDLLIRLCIADAMAQSKEVIENGRIIDRREKKIRRLNEIGRIIKNY